MRTTILFLVLLLLPAVSSAEEPLLKRPHWSLEIKGGVFAPALNDWPAFYGQHDMAVYAASLAYKVRPWLELGAGAGAMSAKGNSVRQVHQTAGEETTYELNPVDVFIMMRGVVWEDQWAAPYIAVGWTRMYYREMIQGQDTVRGSADGYHVRGGLQFSLDDLDSRAANRMYADYGVYHTYFFMEAAYTSVIESTTSIELGGTAYFGGLLFEF